MPEVRIGDEVYGLADFWRDGTAAEFVAVRAADLAPKPRSLDHPRAAAVPLSALTAWQGLFDQAGLQSGQRLLIHGVAGGVGSYAVQFPKWRGAPGGARKRRRLSEEHRAKLAEVGKAHLFKPKICGSIERKTGLF